MPDYSLIGTGGLTKPATVLIEKISNAVGTLWEPNQIRGSPKLRPTRR